MGSRRIQSVAVEVDDCISRRMISLQSGRRRSSMVARISSFVPSMEHFFNFPMISALVGGDTLMILSSSFSFLDGPDDGWAVEACPLFDMVMDDLVS